MFTMLLAQFHSVVGLYSQKPLSLFNSILQSYMYKLNLGIAYEYNFWNQVLCSFY